jgi:membrane-bound serine protease (ClpP class)
MRNRGGQLLGFLAAVAATVTLWSGTGHAAPGGAGTNPEFATTQREAAPTPAAVITLEGVVDDYSRDALFKRFAEAKRLGAKVVILKLDTPGGLVTAGLDISLFLKQKDDLHVIALVHDKAYSAGIMIGLACDELVMEPGSYIGDSAPIVMDPAGGLQTLGKAERAKAESPILADFRDSAVRNGYDPILAEAMVSYGKVVRWVEYAPGADFKSEISDSESRPPRNTPRPGERRFVDDAEFATLTKDGWREVREPGVPSPIDSADTLLTVSADVAKAIGLSKQTVSSPQALATQRGYTIVGEFAPGGGERLVEFLNSSAVRVVLLIVFMMSLYIALHTPGAGGAEAVAMICLGTLIGIPLLTGYAQWWEIAAILIGLVLLAVELFVIPGFGVAGIAGIVLILGGMVMTFVGNTPGLPGVWRLPQVWAGVQNGLLAVVVSFAVSGMLALWIRKYLPKLPYLNRLVLQGTPATAGAPVNAVVTSEIWPFVGTIGRAVSDLKPGGSAEFPYADDRRTAPVVSDSGYVTAGTKLVVREVHGSRVVVRPVV